MSPRSTKRRGAPSAVYMDRGWCLSRARGRRLRPASNSACPQDGLLGLSPIGDTRTLSGCGRGHRTCPPVLSLWAPSDIRPTPSNSLRRPSNSGGAHRESRGEESRCCGIFRRCYSDRKNSQKKNSCAGGERPERVGAELRRGGTRRSLAARAGGASGRRGIPLGCRRIARCPAPIRRRRAGAHGVRPWRRGARADGTGLRRIDVASTDRHAHSSPHRAGLTRARRVSRRTRPAPRRIAGVSIRMSSGSSAIAPASCHSARPHGARCGAGPPATSGTLLTKTSGCLFAGPARTGADSA